MPVAGSTGGTESSARPRRRALIAAVIAAFALAVDIVSKQLAVAWLTPSAPVRVIGEILTLRLVRNSGAAFGVGGGSTILFTLVALVVVIVLTRVTWRVRCVSWAVALGLLLGGAMGNLVDRFFRSPGPLRGEVVDWIHLTHWPVFNLADSAIVCGGVLMVILAARRIRIDGSRTGDE